VQRQVSLARGRERSGGDDPHVDRREDGETFTQSEVLVFTLVDGKIPEIQDYFGDIALNDRLFS
jgi:ketosteroid isomerase-like protein